MKKGFTLIELLAVLVILAIIALIATPIILNIINDAKDSANKRSIEMYAKSIENSVVNNLLTNKGDISNIVGIYSTTKNRTITSKNNSTKYYEINYKGTEVVCDYIEINEQGKIYLRDCLMNQSDYEITKENLNKIITKDPDAPNLKTYSYNIKEEIDYSKYEKTAHYQVGDNVIATLYDNEQLGGKAGEYTLVFTGSGDMYDYTDGPFAPYTEEGYSKDVTKVIIEYGITSIGDYTFTHGPIPDENGFVSLTSVTIPNSVTSIGETAFCGSTSLTSIKIPSSVTKIDMEAFRDCISLTEIIIPDSVTSIGAGAFWGCTSLTSITIPSNVTSIGYYAFSNCRNLANITIPNSVTYIEKYAFKGCTSLTEIIIPDSVTNIDNTTFEDSKNLKTIYYKGTATGAPWGATNATVVTN